MKKIIFSIILLIPVICFSQNRYIKNGGSDSNTGLSDAQAWATIEKARTAGRAGQIAAGDTIFLKRGSTLFSADRFNGMTWWCPPTGISPSGTAGHPIVFDSYGTGDLPNVLFPYPATTDSTSRRPMSFEGCQYIVVRNIQFNENRFPLSKMIASKTSAGIVFGERGSGQETYNSKVENCYFSKVGLGVVIVGGTDSVVNCVMDSLGNVDAIGSDSYGCNGITFSGNHHYFAYNNISGGWCYSSAFGLNGGAFEAYNTCDSNKIVYNTLSDNGAVIEWGAQAASSTCKDDTLAYNFVSNCGNFSYINVNGPFTTTPARINIWNNVIIENRQSRYSGVNYGQGIDTFPTWNPPPPAQRLPSAETRILQNNGSPSANPVWNFQNNIIYNTNNMDVYTSTGIIIHANNLAFFKAGSNWGYTPAGSETSTLGQVFLDTASINPVLWDVHMPSLLKSGTVFITPDFSGQTVTNPATVGIFQRYGVLPVNRITIPFKLQLPGGGSVNIGKINP